MAVESKGSNERLFLINCYFFRFLYDKLINDFENVNGHIKFSFLVPITMTSLPTPPPLEAATEPSLSVHDGQTDNVYTLAENSMKKKATESASLTKEVVAVVSPDASPSDDDTTEPKTCIYLLYDERMTKHQPLDWNACNDTWPSCSAEIPAGYVFENPERIRRIHWRLEQLQRRLGSVVRFHRLSCQPASRETILLAHSQYHYYELEGTSILEQEELATKSKVDDDVYYCPETFLAASLACGGIVSCVNSVLNQETSITRAVALVRPPGHHACQEKAMGA